MRSIGVRGNRICVWSTLWSIWSAWRMLLRLSRARCEEEIRQTRPNGTNLRLWYLPGPGHWWHVVVPIYKLAERWPSTSARTRQLVPDVRPASSGGRSSARRYPPAGRNCDSRCRRKRIKLTVTSAPMPAMMRTTRTPVVSGRRERNATIKILDNIACDS